MQLAGQLTLKDDRQLGYRLFGAPLGEGTAALYFHGHPTSSREGELWQEAVPAGVALICFDRPGAGGSSFDCRSSLQSVAADAAELLDHLHVPAAVVMGMSGGAPFATAFAAGFPQRTLALVLVAPLGPIGGPLWEAGGSSCCCGCSGGSDSSAQRLARALVPHTRCMFASARWRLGLAWLLHRASKYVAENHPGTLKGKAFRMMCPPDVALLDARKDIEDSLVGMMQHGYARGARGPARETWLLAQPWQFDVRTLQCRAWIWQGGQDINVPASHAQWYAAHIPGVVLRMLHGEGHISLPVHHGRTILQEALALECGSSATASDCLNSNGGLARQGDAHPDTPVLCSEVEPAAAD